jgi:hypothetical protein
MKGRLSGIAVSFSYHFVEKTLDTHKKKSYKGIPEPRTHGAIQFS